MGNIIVACFLLTHSVYCFVDVNAIVISLRTYWCVLLV